jgi:predicted amidohydrolase
MRVRNNNDFETAELTDLLHPELEKPISVGLVTTKTSALFGSDVERIIELIEVNAGSGMYDFIVTPEYGFFPKTGPLDVEQRDQYLNIIKKVSKLGVMIIGNFIWKSEGKMHNTCYVVYNGEEVISYDKRVDCGDNEVALRYSLEFKCGNKLGVFEHLGLKCVLEICADRGTSEREGVRDKDLYFLVSCGASTLRSNCIHDEGYLICVDGHSYGGKVSKNLQRN